MYTYVHIYAYIYIHVDTYIYICMYVYLCISLQEALTIEAMRHLMSHHMLQEEEEAGRGETEADGV